LIQRFVIQQSSNNKTLIDPVVSSQQMLQPIKNNFDKHNEDDYVDFYYERKYSANVIT
jgi:hypothetical protein